MKNMLFNIKHALTSLGSVIEGGVKIHLLVPNFYYDNIYDVDYKMLYEMGIRGILFDVDNTIVEPFSHDVPLKLEMLFDDLKGVGFHLILTSNNQSDRLRILKSILNVDTYAETYKPNIAFFDKVLSDFNYKPEDLCIIGDKLLTDILGGNKAGITSVLVNPLKVDIEASYVFQRLDRSVEDRYIKTLSKKNLFNKK